MPSFSKMGGGFPVGYYRATTQWLLRERRDVAARMGYLHAELERIGRVTVYYRKEKEGDALKATEQAIGFSVTKGSSLAKLVQAYIATGGNPFNASKFLYPDETEWVGSPDAPDDLVPVEKYPGGGVVAPKSVAYNDPMPQVTASEDDPDTDTVDKTGYETYEGGFVDSHRYVPGRVGGRIDRGSWDSSTVNRAMDDVRRWANPTIKARLQDMEWRIIKLSDLGEQLRKERDEVVMGAFGGTLEGLPWLDEDKFDPRRLVQNLVADMYALLMEKGSAGTVPVNTSASGDIGNLFFAFSDVPEEAMGPMG